MKILSLFFLAVLVLKAEMIDAVAVVVEGEPITIFDIDELVKKNQLSRADALENLISVRLQEAKIKELKIAVGEDEIDARIDVVARRGNLDAATLREVLTKRGINWNSYREDARKAILSEKLFAAIASNSSILVNEEEIESYYAKHRERFTQPREIVVMQYASKDERALIAIAQNPLLVNPAVTSTQQTLKSAELNPRLLAVLNETSVGKFTPIFPAADRLVTLMVRQKIGSVPRALSDVRSEIVEELRAENEQRLINDYFAKARSLAHIQTIRK